MKKTLNILLGILFVSLMVVLWYTEIRKTSPPNIHVTTATYYCKNNIVLGVKFYDTILPDDSPVVPGTPPTPSGYADISLGNGKSLRLLRTLSASGVRYATTDDSFVFWSKGTGAIILEQGREKNYIDCEQKAPGSVSASTSVLYNDSVLGFSLIVPAYTTPPALEKSTHYRINEGHTYGLIPGEILQGISFTVPSSLTQNTNLSVDSYVSVEHIDNAKTCSASIFLENNPFSKNIIDGGKTYSVASSSGAGAGNRYEETVYAVQGKRACFGVRYFIHYGAIENYPFGTTKEFDKQKLVQSFDKIRKSLVVQK